eukprot:6859990-Prymnesium_polylepis.1
MVRNACERDEFWFCASAFVVVVRCDMPRSIICVRPRLECTFSIHAPITRSPTTFSWGCAPLSCSGSAI